MFGHALAEHDRRYEQGLEWFDVMSKIFTSKERFDHDGEFYKLNRQLDTNEIFNERKRYAGGLSSHPLIGRPEKIVDELVRLQAAGIDGVIRQLQERIAVLHRPGAAAVAAGGLEAIGRALNPDQPASPCRAMSSRVDIVGRSGSRRPPTD